MCVVAQGHNFSMNMIGSGHFSPINHQLCKQTAFQSHLNVKI